SSPITMTARTGSSRTTSWTRLSGGVSACRGSPARCAPRPRPRRRSPATARWPAARSPASALRKPPGVWGPNPGPPTIPPVPHLNEAKKRGTKLVVIDPRRNQIASHADLYVPVWPGSDLVVALWLIGETERRGKVARAFLDAHTRNADLLLAEARPVTLAKA